MTDERFDHSPWLFWDGADPNERAMQLEYQARLAATCDIRLGERSYISPRALLGPMTLRLGSRCYVAAYAYVTDSLVAGDDCTINPYAVVRGSVTLGDGVRIGAHASLLGFDHSMDPGEPIFRQKLSSRGIRIGSDVWIGSTATIVDGITVGDHAVIGAGAVVTRDVPDWAIVGGNPARAIRDRRTPRAPHDIDLPERLRAFATIARRDLPSLLERSWDADRGRYRDAPAAEPTVRAHCDAIEIAILLTGQAPPHLSRGAHVERLRSWQDEGSGLVPELGAAASAESVKGFGSRTEQYHVLSVGYALDLLRSSFAYPIRGADMTSTQLVAALEALPWTEDAWGAGAWIDAWATASMWNRELGHVEHPRAFETLLTWLAERTDPHTGLWGVPSVPGSAMDVVNGFYRVTRGAFAQYGLPLGAPNRVIDTVLDHSRDQRYFAPGAETACNVLDVIHPLWLAGRQTNWRAAEARVWAEQELWLTLDRWQPGAGMAFAAGPTNISAANHEADSDPPDRRAGLQGTEMWLAIVWYLADLLSISRELNYCPRGVHRPDPRPGAMIAAGA